MVVSGGVVFPALQEHLTISQRRVSADELIFRNSEAELFLTSVRGYLHAAMRKDLVGISRTSVENALRPPSLVTAQHQHQTTRVLTLTFSERVVC